MTITKAGVLAVLSVALIGLSACRITEDSPTTSGTFVDAPVQGLYYKATPSGLSGTTNSAGNFQYKAGDTIGFVLGGGGGANGANLGTASPNASGVVTPYDLNPAGGATKNADYPGNVAQMLQTLGGTDATKPIVLPPDNDARLNSIKNVTFNTDKTTYQTSASNNGAPQAPRSTTDSNLSQGTGAIPLEFLGTQWSDTYTEPACPGGTATQTVTFGASSVTFSNRPACATGGNTQPYEVACLPSNCTTADLNGQSYNNTSYQISLSNASATKNSAGRLVPEGKLTVSGGGTTDTLTRGSPANSSTKLEFLGTAWTDTFAASGCPGGTSTITVTFTSTGTAYSNQQACAGSNAPVGSNSYEPSCMPSDCVASDLSGKTYNGTRYDLTLSNSGGAVNSNGKLVPAGTLKLTHANNSVDTLAR
jgi:hypothetical protein